MIMLWHVLALGHVCLNPTPSPSKTLPRIHMEGRVNDVLLPRVSEQYLDKGSKAHGHQMACNPYIKAYFRRCEKTILSAIAGNLYFCSATFGNFGRTFYSWHCSPILFLGKQPTPPSTSLHVTMSPCPPWTRLMWWCVHPGKACQTWEGHARMGILAKRLRRHVSVYTQIKFNYIFTCIYEKSSSVFPCFFSEF